jgi:hypothetical protein
MMSPDATIEAAKELIRMRDAEMPRLDRIRMYWKGKQALPVAPTGVPTEIKKLAEMSRMNVCALAVNVPAQAIGGVVGLRDENSAGNDPLWATWQANKMDAHQSAVHRATFAYGVAYEKLLPGTPVPVSTGFSPRQVTTAYGSDRQWPTYALQLVESGKSKRSFLLYDDQGEYEIFETSENSESALKVGKTREHKAGVCPFVRFRNLEDLEEDLWSEIEAVMSLQDQIDFTTFDLLVAQHFGAFRQRYILGWTSDEEDQKAKAAASRLLTFGDADLKVGEFSQTELSGYLKSRQSSLEHFGVVSQVPPHNLIGQMVNLSAEALVAAEVGSNRKNADREMTLGESWEQWFGLAGRYQGIPLGEGAQVRWKDTEARSLAQTVDALGKMVQMLGVPAEAAWERIPGVTDQDVASWKSLRSADQLNGLFTELDRQTQPDATDPAPVA